MTDRRAKECIIFNPETGISEDGTMHDGVYREWINQPKKERKMTREEAIEQLKNIRSVPSIFIDETIKELVEALQELPTLADFLGLEEGQEYLLNDAEYWHPRIKVENDKIYHFHEDDKGWLEREYVKIDYINDYRQAKKVEPKKYYAKIKGWELTNDTDCYWHKDSNTVHGIYPWSREEASIYTKEEWEKLGIDDSNADFEEVAYCENRLEQIRAKECQGIPLTEEDIKTRASMKEMLKSYRLEWDALLS